MSMEKHDPLYAAYIRILEAELIPAMGCTEPIAIAYAAAKARAVLGTLPESCLVEASGNIIKNVKSVVVPNTGHMRGIPAAASAGIVAGDADAQLQVISRVSPEAREQIKVYCDTHTIQVVPAHNGKVFYIAITVKAGDSSARVKRLTMNGYLWKRSWSLQTLWISRMWKKCCPGRLPTTAPSRRKA